MIQLKDPSLLRSAAYIAGEWCNADSGLTISVRNPATGEVVGTVPKAGAVETQRAIEAADRAFKPWRATTAEYRARILRRWFDLMNEHQDDLALIMTLEQGKPLAEAKGEIAYAAAYVEWFAEEARRTYGDLIPSPWADRDIVIRKEPVGVCAAVTPWNFPAAMITRKVAPALAAGCTMIVKPASQTPLSALALAELASRAGVPAGVLSVITGSAGEIGGALTSSPLVRKLSFTGSTEVGRTLAAQCAPTLKRLSLELGGNAPFIVFDDADLEAAVEGAIASKYRNSGQTCVCANRFLVQSGVYDRFADMLAAAVSRLQVGNGVDAGVQQGPLIDAPSLAKVEELVAEAVQSGAKVAIGGRRHALGGTFYEPTVLTNVAPDARVVNEEIFGPVAPLVRFETEDDAIAIANSSEFGLASYFFSRDLARVWRVAGAIEAGMVGVNTGLISTAVAPFGGVKQSGMGREGSKFGLDEYMETKYVCLGGLKP
ncbi:NAD-dependent succinate-semialdehyde dehydrogenase [Variovorax sp. Sphag1AA]|uniref:NAD-dependent succinate-semialdehyde dehydrogenase n=1 Tax=Variovorax sp. Sphag1AA TaxID=2587027 RepID=UPI001608E360|nr:NAD-dependent succinate-semialdehyde dehydrogenase [Variovorax sp. Sphag1AA]MBB3182163.1 succinate-semialdehyde dehydrogenase/glutarate-semialdehyde dehydrogenase [Variovorax sp. Sphag1AA]